MTTYDYIDSNNRRTVLLCFLYPFSIAALCISVSYLLYVILTMDVQDLQPTFGRDWRNNTLIAVSGLIAANLVWMGVGFLTSKKHSLKNLNLIPATMATEPELVRIVQNISITAGIKVPKIYIFETMGMNAFASGINPNDSAVVFTRGLLLNLKKAELEGVVAHEIAHIVNRDTRLMMLIIYGVSMFAVLGDIALRATRGRSSKNGTVAAFWGAFIICLIFQTIIAPILRMAVSRNREFLADSTAALLTRNPSALAEALLVISSNPYVNELNDVSHSDLCVISPGKRRFFDLLKSHPDTNERVQALLKMAN